MSFYLRKSVSVGPFRFNLSKSGVGVSAGLRGLRVGTGPRGNYVHMGRHGLHYRASLTPSDRSSGRQEVNPTEGQPSRPETSHEPLQDIESADVGQMTDSSSAELLKEIDEKHRKVRILPGAIIFAAMIFLVTLFAQLPWYVIATAVAGGVAIVVFAYRRDVLAKTVVVLYHFDPAMEEAYALVHQWGQALAAAAGFWHIAARGDVRDRKYHAGASHLVTRRKTFAKIAAPDFLKTNVATLAVGVGRQVLHFFPDRLLVFDRGRVGAVGYPDLHLAWISHPIFRRPPETAPAAVAAG